MKPVRAADIQVHALTHRGQVREDNQDAVRSSGSGDGSAAADGPLFGIADGMGGFSHGGVASALALEVLFRTFEAGPGLRPLLRLKRGMEAANLGVCQAANRLGVGRMGTTLTAVHLEGHHFHVAHVGDSRAYLVRDGAAACLTQDHTRVGELVRLRLLGPDKLRTHDQRSVLERCLGLDIFVQPDLFTVEARRGDRLVLCTDGVWAHLEDEDFARFARALPDPGAYNEALLAEALARGSDDNLSLLTVDLRALAGDPRAAPGRLRSGGLLRWILDP